ncbi:MAG TPA: Gfo/Idh/MocA family oxidoreductase, partial [Tepidisphaeraceae bacterium]
MLNVAVIGLGPIGIAAAKAVQRDVNMKLTALVDLDPAKLGKRLVNLDETADADDIAVVSDLDETDAQIDVAILTTGSRFDRIAPNLRQLMKRKCHVVSSCEEMTWPWLRHPHLADVIGGEARSAGVALVGTGVNPGFVMDLLPVAL